MGYDGYVGVKVAYGIRVDTGGEKSEMGVKVLVATSLLPPRGGRSVYNPYTPCTLAVFQQAVAVEQATANDPEMMR